MFPPSQVLPIRSVQPSPLTLVRGIAALIIAALVGAVLAGPAAATSPAGHASATPQESQVAGEVLVRFRRGVAAAERAAVLRETGLGGSHAFAPHTRMLKIRDGQTVAQTLRELRVRPEVATAAPNKIARLSSFVPRDPGETGRPRGWRKLQWNFLAGPGGVNAPEAWQHLIDAGHPGGRGAVVAVLDTGVAYENRRGFRRSPDFSPSDFVPGFDFVDYDRFPNDENGHGTHVASTIGERTNNGVGVTGLAYGARIMPVRVLDRYGAGAVANITAGIRFAVRRGADVINLSFEFDDGRRQVTAGEIPDILAALRYAWRHDVVVVGAAGNETRLEAAYPARYRTVIGVGAITEHGCRAKYSNIGPGVDLVAPGGGRDYPYDPTCARDLAGGRPILQMTYPWAAAFRPPPTTMSYRRFSLPRRFVGTSMAAPHVAATAALVIASGLLGEAPDPAAVEARLQATAVDAGAPGFDPSYGAGRLDAAAATDPAR